MKKSLAILLAFFIVFAPVYSNAVLPALAASVASNGGRVLVGNFIKKVAPQALANAKKAAIGICTKNPKSCGGIGVGLIGALVGDGWNIEVTNNDVTNDIDVDIYKPENAGSSSCTVTYGFGNSVVPPQSMYSFYSAMIVWLGTSNPASEYDYYDGWESPFFAAQSNYSNLPDNVIVQNWTRLDNFIATVKKTPIGSTNSSVETFYANLYYRCLPVVNTAITNNQLNQYITNNNINDIDILDIYNFDFSQYNNITIGGDTYNGTTINNDLAKSDSSEPDKKVSADLKKKLESKELSLDDVTDENCTKNEAGEYDKCGADKEPDPDNPDPDNPDEPEPEKNPACELEENLFKKKICEWIDWTQTKHDKPESGNVDIIDKSDDLEIDEDRIVFADQCPPPTPIELVVMGFPYSEELDYQPFCDFFGMLNPFVVGMGGISSALIIAGGIRRG